jgi:hypothetical protein
VSGKYTLIEVTRLTELESRVRELEAEREELMKYYENQNSENMNLIEGLEAERDRLKSCLYGLLEALQAKHIDELIAKSPEHLIKFGEVVKDSYQEKAAELIELRARHAALVEDAINVVRFIDNDSFDTEGWQEAVDKLKAALAEVK